MWATSPYRTVILKVPLSRAGAAGLLAAGAVILGARCQTDG